MVRKLLIGLIFSLLVCAHLQANMENMWFDRMSRAIIDRDYQGTYVIRGNDNLFAYYLQHSNIHNNSIERIVQLDQNGVEVISTDYSITQFTPVNTPPSAQSIINTSPFSIFANLTSKQLIDNYAISLHPTERICGYQAIVLQLSADKWRHSYKLWIEKKSALPLKVAVINGQGNIIEEYRFVDLDIKDYDEHVKLPSIEEKYKTNIVTTRKKENINDASFTKALPPSPVTWKPTNFKLINSTEITSRKQNYLNYTYSDGLNTFSVVVSKLPENHAKNRLKWKHPT